MLNSNEILQTLRMIDQNKLDVRTITMGISLLDCACGAPEGLYDRVYDRITRQARDLVKTGEAIEREFGIPIVNKRISITPAALILGHADPVKLAHALDRAAKEVGVNFLGGYSALVHKAMTTADEALIRAIPEALATTDVVCSSVNVGTTKAGINMDAVKLMGQVIKEAAERTRDQDGFACAKLVVFANAVEDNPFMAARSTAWARATPPSTWASPAPAWSRPRWRSARARRSTWSPRPSSAPRSRSPAWASWWRRRPAAG